MLVLTSIRLPLLLPGRGFATPLNIKHAALKKIDKPIEGIILTGNEIGGRPGIQPFATPWKARFILGC